MEVSKSGQTFWQAEADALFPAGCKCGNNGGGDCDWCGVYYNGPEHEGYDLWEMEAARRAMRIIKLETALRNLLHGIETFDWEPRHWRVFGSAVAEADKLLEEQPFKKVKK